MIQIKNRRNFKPSVEVMPARAAASSLNPMIVDDGSLCWIQSSTGPISISNQSTVMVYNPTDPNLTVSGNSTTPAITCENSSLVIVDGSIHGGDATENDFPSSGIVAINSSVTLYGGSVSGGSDTIGNLGAERGISILGGSFYGYGGTVTGGSCVAFNGQTALYSAYANSFYIGGGTYQAGNQTAAVSLNEHETEHAQIDGGTFIGGVRPLGGRGYALFGSMTDESSLTIAGGQFNGGIAVRLTGSGKVDFQGPDLSYANGVISGHLTDGQAIAENLAFHNMPAPPTVVQTPGQIEFTA